MPVKRSDRCINANCPPEDVSCPELRRFWGEPREKDQNLLDDIKVKGKKEKTLDVDFRWGCFQNI